jgi:hypothetical protein
MDSLSLFGALVLAAMLVFYALEDRSPTYVLLFAGTCVASSIYAFMQGAWPFGVVETIWTAVALQRWRSRLTTRAPADSRPIACDMSALSPDERRRYDGLRSRVTAAVKEVVATESSFHLRLDESVSAPEVAEWMALEHRCCPFLNIAIALKSDRSMWVELGGSPRIKKFLREEFGPILSAR